MALRRREEETQPRLLEVDASMTGTLNFKDPVNLQINGQFEGNLETRGSLTIGQKAQVKATIRGERISVAGSLEGQVTASERLELLSTARVTGKVITPRLIIQEGAVLQGTCEMEAKSEEPRSWMSVEELARYLEVDASTIAEWTQSGRLPAQREGAQWRYDRRRIEDWLAQEKIK